MRVFLTSYGQRSSGWENPPSGQLMPPMMSGRHRLHFDVSPLFFAPSIIMDRRSLEAMIDETDGLPEHGRETLRIFNAEGLIDIEDYRDLTDAEKDDIGKANARDNANPDSVADKALRTVDDWYRIGAIYKEMWSPAHVSSGLIPYAYNAYLQEIGHYDNVAFATEHWAKLKEGFASGSEEAKQALVVMGATLNDHHNTTARLSLKYGAASYHWRNLAGQAAANASNEQVTREWSGESGQRERLVLDALVPAGFEDTPPGSLGRMFKHAKMENVRRIVREAAASDLALPDELKNAIIEAVTLENQKLTDISQARKWLRIPKLALGWLPLGGTAADEAGTAVIETAVDLAYKEGIDRAFSTAAGKAGGEIPTNKRELAAIMRFISCHQRGNERTFRRMLGLN